MDSFTKFVILAVFGGSSIFGGILLISIRGGNKFSIYHPYAREGIILLVCGVAVIITVIIIKRHDKKEDSALGVGAP